MSVVVEPGSFRDPSGFLFYKDKTVFRQVQKRYRDSYDQLMGSSLYESLVGAGLLVAHTEEPIETAVAEDAYRILRPERIPFISYPYEWCFSELKDAALATLKIQKQALDAGMSLKDASAYNIQFRSGKPILIDTLSFERYSEGAPWIAYRQFCQHFLAPLALMSRTDVRLGSLLRTNIDGVPLDLASRLLPPSTWLQPGLLAHIHLHGAAQKRYEGAPGKGARPHGVSRNALLGLIDSLQSTVSRLSWSPKGTTWAEYYTHTNYSDKAMEGKREIVAAMVDHISPSPRLAWDLGANTGVFTRLASERGIYSVAWDMDPAAVERNYLECRRSGEANILPLVGDLANPSPDLGWALQERRSQVARGPADLVLALALVHHLAIGNNVPLSRIASFFAAIGTWAIVEFVPKSDSQVQRLLSSREDIFDGYSSAGFEAAFCECYDILEAVPVPDCERKLYLLRARK
jgi:hypothetical protein